MQLFTKLRHVFDRDTKIKLLLLLIAIIIGAMLETLALSLISPFISILLNNTIIETNRYLSFVNDLLGFTSTAGFLGFLTFMLAAVYVFRAVYVYIVSKVQYRVIARRQANLSAQLLRKILGYSYLYHTKKNLAELQTIVTGDVGNMFGLVNNIFLMLTDLFMSLFIVLFLAIVSPLMTAFVLTLSGICVILYMKAFRRKVRITGIKQREASIGMRKAVNQSVGGIKEVKVLRREDFFIRFFVKSSNVFVKYSTQFQVLNAIPKLVIETICFGGALLAIGFLILGGADITGLVPQLSVFVLAAFRLLPAVTRQVGMVNSIITGIPSVDAVYKSLFGDDKYAHAASLDAVSLEKNAEARLENGVAASDPCDISIVNVTFQYPDTNVPVLSDVSLTIPHRKSVALIGPSGAGKSTLADIILGILAPDAGGVFYEGKSIHHNFDEWSSRVGYIPQQIYLLDESILANVAFGIAREDIDEAKALYALEQAQLGEFISTLPNGIETVVGDRGVRLSGGQRQRIGIARALYNDPSILVLDEATSSLDTETEKAVMEAIERFQGEKTMLIIAHRLSTIEHCDIKYRVENGGVVRS